MYNKLYNGIIELLKTGSAEEIEPLRELGKLPEFLTTAYDFDPLEILRLKQIEIDGLPDILLVLAFSPKDKPNAKFADYIMQDGKLCKVILVNMYYLTDKDQHAQLYMLGWCIWNMIFTIADTYPGIVNVDAKSKTMSNFTNTLYYAPAVMMIKVIDRLYNATIKKEDICQLINLFYKNAEITIEGVKSIEKAIEQVGLKSLLDYNLWTSVDPLNYPGAAFADNNQKEDDKNETV